MIPSYEINLELNLLWLSYIDQKVKYSETVKLNQNPPAFAKVKVKTVKEEPIDKHSNDPEIQNIEIKKYETPIDNKK